MMDRFVQQHARILEALRVPRTNQQDLRLFGIMETAQSSIINISGPTPPAGVGLEHAHQADAGRHAPAHRASLRTLSPSLDRAGMVLRRVGPRISNGAPSRDFTTNDADVVIQLSDRPTTGVMVQLPMASVR